MDLAPYLALNPDEKPLDRIPPNGGYTSIFRTITCIGDSLSSGEFERVDATTQQRTYHDLYEYSWGQFIGRMAGAKVQNFSRGGMTGKWYCDSFANENGYWDPALATQAYIVALGCNEANQNFPTGSITDVNWEDETQNSDTFAGYYGRILTRYRRISPNARFFLMTAPRTAGHPGWKDALMDQQADVIRAFAAKLPHTFVIDLRKYAPVYDEAFKKSLFMHGHMNPMGYKFTADIVSAYIDFIIRHNPAEFEQVGFIGTSLYQE